MDQGLIDSLTKLIANIGFPGAIVIYLMWMGRQLLPSVERFVLCMEGMKEGIEKINEELGRLRLTPQS